GLAVSVDVGSAHEERPARFRKQRRGLQCSISITGQNADAAGICAPILYVSSIGNRDILLAVAEISDGYEYRADIDGVIRPGLECAAAVANKDAHAADGSSVRAADIIRDDEIEIAVAYIEDCSTRRKLCRRAT